MTAARGRYISGEQTRTRLVEAAERLFARRGYDGVTLAEIRKTAGQHNSSVIGYYFGTKEGLLRAVFSHRLPAVNEERDAMVARLTVAKGELSTRDALWTIALPLAHTIGRGNHYVAMLNQLINRDQLAEHYTAADPAVTAGGRAAYIALKESITHLPDDVLNQRLLLVYASIVRSLARFDADGTPPDQGELSALVDAWEALLLAPMSPETVGSRRGIGESAIRRVGGDFPAG
ncbi:TetR/AcrR family transcriptional regulator [Rhodococcus chondri]|uniref:TetR/AcrR family transcriptional regulator n=1 Tax=Rhodococcus chondri TaxID=3065941 RepID=A0ABU7JPV0_9NOCA|nr:TetR/AcrR family transcriptional regulator [Rhodococcus sp. CC-R104]MEE2032045.1 TetR/AcrR family transcriptional regulator [Rhodococcus sp. CC-R104]